MDYSDVLALYNGSAAHLFRMENGPLACLLLLQLRKKEAEGVQVSIPEAVEMLGGLISKNDLQDAAKPALLLTAWMGGPTPLLLKSGKNPHGVLSIPYQIRQALDFIVRLTQQQDIVPTETTLHQLLGVIRRLAQGTERNPEVHKQQLKADIAQLQDRLKHLEQGGLPDGFSPQQTQEQLQALHNLLAQLLTDFAGVKERFGLVSRRIITGMQTEEQTPFDVLDLAFRDAKALLESPQGKSYRAFQDLFRSSGADILRRLLEDLEQTLDLGELANASNRLEKANGEIQEIIFKLAGYMHQYLRLQQQQRDEAVTQAIARVGALMQQGHRKLPLHHEFETIIRSAPSIQSCLRPTAQGPEQVYTLQMEENTEAPSNLGDLSEGMKVYQQYYKDAYDRVTAAKGGPVSLNRLLLDVPPENALQILPYLYLAATDTAHKIEEGEVEIAGKQKEFRAPNITYHATD